MYFVAIKYVSIFRSYSLNFSFELLRRVFWQFVAVACFSAIFHCNDCFSSYILCLWYAFQLFVVITCWPSILLPWHEFKLFIIITCLSYFSLSYFSAIIVAMACDKVKSCYDLFQIWFGVTTCVCPTCLGICCSFSLSWQGV